MLCEKPIASNTLQLKEIIKSAKDNKVLLMEAMKTTFLPNLKEIRNNLKKLIMHSKIVNSSIPSEILGKDGNMLITQINAIKYKFIAFIQVSRHPLLKLSDPIILLQVG